MWRSVNEGAEVFGLDDPELSARRSCKARQKLDALDRVDA